MRQVKLFMKRVSLIIVAAFLAVPSLPVFVGNAHATTQEKITFINGSQLNFISPDGTDQYTIQKGRYARLSPDGSKILFILPYPGCCGDWDIHTMNVDGTNDINLTPINRTNDWQPTWSPDGTKIAYLGRLQTAPFTQGTIVMNADGSDKQVLFPTGVCAGLPEWSPDGTKIACSGLSIINVDGSGQTPLAPGSAPRWSPDGTRIAYLGFDSNIHVINIDGTADTILVNGPFIGSYAWSPDSSTLAYTQLTGNSAPWRLLTIPATGGTSTQIYSGGSMEFISWGVVRTGVTNTVPNIDPIAPSTVAPGDTYATNVIFTDPESYYWSASINYGDGTPVEQKFITNHSFALNHTYANPNDYTVSISLTDEWGDIGTQTAQVTVSQPDTTPPEVTGTPDSQANGDGWYNHDVTINWSATDPAPSSGTPTTPPPTLASLEGTNTYTSDPSCDPAANCAPGSLDLSIDKTLPSVDSVSWSNNPLLSGQNTTLTVGTSDTLNNGSGIKTVEYSIDGGTPQPMTFNSVAGTWFAAFGSSLAVNTYNITVTATDFADNSKQAADVLAIYTTSNGYVTGHASVSPTTSDTLPIALDTSNNPAKLVMGFTNVTAPMTGSFDLSYVVKNNKDEFNLSSTSISWVVVQDSTHASILGHADMSVYVNGTQTITQNVSVRFDIVLGTNGSPDQVTVKIFNPGVDPNTGTPAYEVNDQVLANGSNIRIHQ